MFQSVEIYFFVQMFQSVENGLNTSRSVSESSNHPSEEEETKNRKNSSSTKTETEIPEPKIPDQQQTTVQVTK